jgi:hypothetical protein
VTVSQKDLARFYAEREQAAGNQDGKENR